MSLNINRLTGIIILIAVLIISSSCERTNTNSLKLSTKPQPATKTDVNKKTMSIVSKKKTKVWDRKIADVNGERPEVLKSGIPRR